MNTKFHRLVRFSNIMLGMGVWVIYAKLGSHQDWNFAFRSGALGDTSRVVTPYWALFLSYIPAQFDWGYIIWIGLGLFLVMTTSIFLKSPTWVVLLSYQLGWCLWYGQIDPFVVFGLALGYWSLQHSRSYILGIAIMLVLIKPQIGLMPAIAFFLWSPDKPKTSLAALSIFLASMLAWPSWIKDIFLVWSSFTEKVENTITNTNYLPYWISIPLILITILIQKLPGRDRLLGLTAANLLLAPYSPIYSQLSLIVFPLPAIFYSFAFIPWVIAIQFGPFFHWKWAQLFPLLVLIYSVRKGRLLFPSFGRWDCVSGRYFHRERVWWGGWLWTPICRISIK
jgi:hypothetical protein